ncbi:hypothetical protein E3H11_22330 [Bradyrhizobium brasilense]|uniref:hypothetical protein n=1 Tax=Bradyrhizobium brasilense TaxID=1419277 RepID=UPI0014570117|nr:hypothetical protein [Bradyrhizobium brasilense]NLS71605.1 hypothetical protein [Bradyrhizobium brasilense]
MPLVRYFLFTGATLLGLLLLTDWYFSAPAPVTVARNDIDRTIIRIRSQHKWPEAIRMDTSTPLPAAAPAPTASAAVAAPVPAAPPATIAQVDASRAAPPARLERSARHAKPTRQAQRERRQRLAQRGQRFASYREPEWQGWSFPNW